MSYSQDTLLSLIKNGKIMEEVGTPVHIETVISNVFLFDQNVYKLYKNNSDFFNEHFNDLSSNENRLAFTKKDFEWNTFLSPSIYKSVLPIAVINGEIQEAANESAEEFVIVMRKVDTAAILYEKLVRGDITIDDCAVIGESFARMTTKIQTGEHVADSLATIMKERIQNVRIWIQSAEKYISKEESGVYCDRLEQLLEEQLAWFENTSVMTDGDFHSHNAVFENGHFLLIDSYPPKESWMLGHSLISAYRVGVDILALSGKQEYFEGYMKGFERGLGKEVDRTQEQFFTLYVSLLAVSYLYMLSEGDPSKLESAMKYHTFIQTI